MTGGVDVGPGLVDFRVDGKGREINGFVAFNDVSVFIDEDQVGDFD
jgi:hypothetical protein